MSDNPTVTGLVTRARNGDYQAWNALVERYAPLIRSICRRHQLSRADADDTVQYVWLQLVDHLVTIRDPDALPGWLATTARRECAKIRRTARGPQAARSVPDAGNIADEQAGSVGQELLTAERRAALSEALTRLAPRNQQLMAVLIEDPPVPYARISTRLGIPAGSIGPTRRRCLEKLRRDPALAALADAAAAAGQLSRQSAATGS